MRKMLNIKWERIMILLFIPLAIKQFTLANEMFKVASIITSIIIFGGFSLAIKLFRQELKGE